MILKLLINTNVTGKINAFIICIPFALLGGLTYILITYKTNLLTETIGEDYIYKILKKLKIKKVK